MSAPPPVAAQVFGDRLDLAGRFVAMLAMDGIQRGVVGPRESDRLWDRHLLNSAVLGELVPQRSRVLDVGSGAGFPGIPLALARTDLQVTLLEPMQRRVTWLDEVVRELGLPVMVRRGRAGDETVRAELGGQDVVTARAVAPLRRLAQWALPLTRVGGLLLAMKGDSAAEEVDRDRVAVHHAGGGGIRVVRCGAAMVDTPATVVVVERRSVEAGERWRRSSR